MHLRRESQQYDIRHKILTSALFTGYKRQISKCAITHKKSKCTEVKINEEAPSTCKLHVCNMIILN